MLLSMQRDVHNMGTAFRA